MKKIISILIICIAISQLHAQIDEPTDSISKVEIDEALIIGSKRNTSDYVNKMPLENLENPQVYNSINNAVLEKQGILSVESALRNVPGLQIMWQPTGRGGDGGAYVSMRGFITQTNLRNGLNAPVTSGIDVANLEKLEVLKGPSGTLFGSVLTSYGGLINRVTKKPLNEFKGNISVAAGSYDLYRASADVNVPLTQDKKLNFRFNGAYTSEGTFQTEGFNKQMVLAPSLTYKPNDRLTINFDAEIFQGKSVGNQMFFYLTNKLGFDNIEDSPLDYENSYMGKGLEQKNRSINLFGQLNYKISENITSSTNLSTSSSYSDGFGSYFYLTPMEDGNLGIARADQSTDESKSRSIQIQQNFNGDFTFGKMRNRVVVGFDYWERKDDLHFFGSTFDVVPINTGFDYSAFNGDALQTVYDGGRIDFIYPQLGKTITLSSYISNVLSVTKNLDVLMALRIDNFKIKNIVVGTTESPSYNQTAFSPKVGVVFQPIDNVVSIFTNYQNSFKNIGFIHTTEGEKIAQPEQANQFEAGIKVDLVKNILSGTVSYYNIQVKDVVRDLPGSTTFEKIQDGTLRSSGIEIDLNSNPTRGLEIFSGFGYNNSEYTKADASVVNRRPTTSGSPYTANFFINYEFQNSLKGLGIGFGGNYASENKITNILDVNTGTVDEFYLPSYFILNANAYYVFKKFRLGVKVDNLTNEKYWIGYTTANPQKLINAVGTFTYNF